MYQFELTGKLKTADNNSYRIGLEGKCVIRLVFLNFKFLNFFFFLFHHRAITSAFYSSPAS